MLLNDERFEYLQGHLPKAKCCAYLRHAGLNIQGYKKKNMTYLLKINKIHPNPKPIKSPKVHLAPSPNQTSTKPIKPKPFFYIYSSIIHLCSSPPLSASQQTTVHKYIYNTSIHHKNQDNKNYSSGQVNYRKGSQTQLESNV